MDVEVRDGVLELTRLGGANDSSCLQKWVSNHGPNGSLSCEPLCLPCAAVGEVAAAARCCEYAGGEGKVMVVAAGGEGIRDKVCDG